MRIKILAVFLFLLGQSIFGQTLNDIWVNQVKNFRATSDGSTITLNWDWKSSISTTGFRVYRSETGADPFPRPTGGKIQNPNARSFTDTGGPDGYTLEPNQDYYYVVQPYLEPGDRRAQISTFIKIRLGDATNGFPDDHEGPTNLTATRNGNDVTITWDWDPSGLDIQGFKFERIKDYGDWEGDEWTTTRRISNPNARSFTDVNVGPGVYVYRCFAYDGNYNYTFSQNVEIEVTDGVTNQLSVTPSNRDVTSSAGSTTFSVSSDVSWTVSESVSWITSVSPGNGSNNVTLTVNYEANGTTSARSGTVTVSGGGITRNVTVTQAADVNDELSVTPSNRDVSSSAGSTTFDVSSNVSWTVSEDVSWVTSVSPSSGSNNGSFTVNYETNETTSSRSGTVTVSGSGITRNVTVTQAADGVTNQLSVTPSNRDVSSSSGNTTFDVSSDVSWTVSESVSWITSVSPATGSNNGTLTVNYEANGTTSSRSGTVTVSGGGITRNVTVTQAADVNDELSVTPSSRDVSSSSGSTTFDVSSNVSWTVSESVSWITSVSPSSGSNNGSFTVNYEANGTTSARSGTITVSGGSITRSVTVSQNLAGDNIDLTDMRANQPRNLKVTSNSSAVTLTWEWNSNSTVSGFKVYRSPDGQEPWTRPTGGKFFDPSARSFVDDKDNLQAGEKYYYLVQAFLEPPGHNSLISQERQIIIGGGEPSDVLPNPQNVTAIVDNGTVTVNWDFEPGSSSITGFKLERQYNFGEWARPVNGKIADANARSYTDEADLPDGIYVYRVFAYLSSGGDQNYPFSETAFAHKGSSISYFEITPSNQDVDSQGDTTIFDISSVINWSLIDKADWLNVSPANGLNSRTITVVYDTNITENQRIGSITILGGGITKTATITQAPASMLEVNPANLNVGHETDSTTFEIISNVSWSISDDADWLTVSPSSGSSNSTIKAIFESNTASTQRVGIITITGGGIELIVTVTQDLMVGVEDLEFVDEIPQDYYLYDNYPNPFNPSTLIQFAVPEPSTSQLKVFDLLGNEIAVLVDHESIPAGKFRYEFHATELPSGVYIYILSTKSNTSGRSFKSVKKMMFLK
jgi:hypothetical protein